MGGRIVVPGGVIASADDERAAAARSLLPEMARHLLASELDDVRKQQEPADCRENLEIAQNHHEPPTGLYANPNSGPNFMVRSTFGPVLVLEIMPD